MSLRAAAIRSAVRRFSCSPSLLHAERGGDRGDPLGYVLQRLGGGDDQDRDARVTDLLNRFCGTGGGLGQDQGRAQREHALGGDVVSTCHHGQLRGLFEGGRDVPRDHLLAEAEGVDDLVEAAGQRDHPVRGADGDRSAVVRGDGDGQYGGGRGFERFHPGRGRGGMGGLARGRGRTPAARHGQCQGDQGDQGGQDKAGAGEAGWGGGRRHEGTVLVVRRMKAGATEGFRSRPTVV